MPVHNQEIAAIFKEMADLLEIEGANPFRVRAYRNGARVIEDLGQSVQSLVEQEEDLTKLSGIGKGLAAQMEEIVGTGTTEELGELRGRLPSGITDLLNVPGLGPKRVKLLIEELSIKSLDDVKKAAEKGRIRDLAGMGEKIEHQILAAIVKQRDTSKRYLRANAAPYADAFVAYLEKVTGVKKLALAGSYRRGRETVGDLDILVVAAAKSPVMQKFVEYDEVTEILAQGKTKCSVVLRSGIQVDLRSVEPRSFGSALHYFTGSKAHNIAVRKRAQDRGLKVNEYGVFKGEEYVAGKTEKEVFETLDLPYIEPELREARGEMDAAEADAMPRLVNVKHIMGDLHAHTTHSDGKHSIEEMARAAKALGYEYVAITDHSKRLTIANGLDEDRLRAQMDEIDSVNDRVKGITILKGNEVDILEDGSLDLDDDVLCRLDFVIGAVHSKFNLPGAKQTERILRAMDQPYFTILAHPSGRLLLSRDAYDVDVPKLIRHAKARGCYMELNANPQRLDLHDVHCLLAKEEGVLVSIDTDAHSTGDFDNISFGVSQARRGWLEKKDVLNTRTLKQLIPLLKKTMG